MATLTRIKICGIKTVEDAIFAANAGADAIGLVFYGPSPRCIDVEMAVKISANLPPFVSCVGLFVNENNNEIRRIADAVKLDLIQFHGAETADQCAALGLPYIKAVQVKDAEDISQALTHYSTAKGLLLDAWHPELAGGTGEQFDWALVPNERQTPLILAGGLTAENVATAIRQTTPYAVDVSGGVEAQKGIKSQQKIADFIAAVASA